MLKFPNLSDDYMIEYYTCLKEILNLYQIVAHPSNNYECLISKVLR